MDKRDAFIFHFIFFVVVFFNFFNFFIFYSHYRIEEEENYKNKKIGAAFLYSLIMKLIQEELLSLFLFLKKHATFILLFCLKILFFFSKKSNKIKIRYLIERKK